MTTPAAVRVTVGQKATTTTAVSYGTRTIKSASDLSLTNAQDGFPIIYRANTNSFVVGPATAEILSIDNGFF
jgi:hypothetical protein